MMKGNKEQDKRIQVLKESLKAEKDEINELGDLKKEQALEYETAMKELRKIDGEYRNLVDKRIMLESGKQQNINKEYEQEDKEMANKQKKKILKRIAGNKATQMEMKVKAQKKNNNLLDKELAEIKATIEDKLEKNEQMSKRVKELKGMIILRNNDSNLSGLRPPVSPRQSDNIKTEEL